MTHTRSQGKEDTKGSGETTALGQKFLPEIRSASSDGFATLPRQSCQGFALVQTLVCTPVHVLPQAFAQIRIPRSLNIPLFAIKTRTFLQGKSVMLDDEGVFPRRLTNACEQLTPAGSEARFLAETGISSISSLF